MALISLAAAALIVIAAFALPWASVTVPLVLGLSATGTEVTFTGREIYPLAAVLPWLGLASVGGVFATRGWARVIVGLVVLATGLVSAVSAISFALDPRSAVLNQLNPDQLSPDQLSPDQLNPDPLTQWASTPWWVLGLIGALGLVAVGGLIVARGRTWPGLSQRFERSAGTKAGPDAAPISALSAWDALDRGEDPTT
jgi:uncharacterized membrane protein (TIGR02234 family)